MAKPLASRTQHRHLTGMAHRHAPVYPRRRSFVRAAAMLAVLSGSSSAQAPPPSDAANAPRPPHYWRDVGKGFLSSLLAHEGAHVVTALVVGGRPTVGLDRGRPTVFSGIDVAREPHKQFLFSSMGLNVQAALDEAILDVPHERGGAFERGLLAGGIGTALFYITIGRTASVSDVEFMARTSSLSKTDISLIYGGIAAMHTIRVARNGHYPNFFVRPATVGAGGMQVGIRISPSP